MRVKFDILNRDLISERKVNQELVKINEKYASEIHEQELEIESQMPNIKSEGEPQI